MLQVWATDVESVKGVARYVPKKLNQGRGLGRTVESHAGLANFLWNSLL